MKLFYSFSLVIFISISGIVKAQPFLKHYNINLNNVKLKIDHTSEPAIMSIDSSIYFRNFKFNSLGLDNLYIELRGKNGDNIGWISLINGFIYASNGDSTLVVPDSLRNGWDLSFARSFICPDSIIDNLFHFILVRDSNVNSVASGANFTDLFYTDLVYVAGKIQVKGKNNNFIGRINNPRYQKGINPKGGIYSRYKKNMILIDPKFNYFKFICFSSDTQEIYNCNFSKIILKNSFYFPILFPEYSFEGIYTYPLNYDINYISKNIILTATKDQIDTNYNDKYKIILLKMSDGFNNFDTIYCIDTMMFYNKFPFKTLSFDNFISYSFIPSPSGEYLYIAYTKLDYYMNPVLEIYKYEIKHLKKQLIYRRIFDKKNIEYYGSPHFNNGYFNLCMHPSGKIVLYIKNNLIMSISKPDLPFYYNKFYINYPSIYTDTSFYNKFDSTNKKTFRFTVYNSLFPLRTYLYLNTTEEYSCKSVLLHTDADTAYKTFEWYVYNNQSQSFDTSYGKTCYINDVSGGVYYKLKGITDNGYYAWYSDSLYPHVKPKAAMASTYSQGCQYLSYTFKDSSSSLEINPSFKQRWHWYFGDGSDTSIIDTGSYPNYGKGDVGHIYTKSGTYNIKLIYNNGYCEDTIEYINAVNIIPAPTPFFTVNHQYSCSPFNLQLKDTSGLAVKRHYQYGDGKDTFANGYNTTFVANHLYNSIGKYQISQTLTGSSGCVTSSSMIIEVVAPFKINLGNDTTLCEGEGITLKSIISHANYEWNNGTTDSILYVTKSGQYMLKAKVGACSSTDTIAIDYYRHGECENHIWAYPNPFSSDLNLDGFLKKEDELTINIYDMNGKLVVSIQTIKEQYHFIISIQTEGLSQGIYILSVTSAELNRKIKIIKF